jgi:xanthine dehydrogenase small subunit
VPELKACGVSDGVLRIGAGVSLTDAYEALAQVYPQVREMGERFASVPIRNAGTLGGNVANGSPIGDSMPWLIALAARVVLRNRARARSLPLEDLYVDYMQTSMLADEIVEAIEVPLPVADQRFRTYKVSKRYDSDISAVCAAFCIRLSGEWIVESRIAFGGMAATPTRARRCEAALSGEPWSEATVAAGMTALSEDFTPLTDMRASAAYRTRVAQNLLYRFYLETRPGEPLAEACVNVFAGNV